MNYRNTRNYENLEKCIYDGVGEYNIPEIEPAHINIRRLCRFTTITGSTG